MKPTREIVIKLFEGKNRKRRAMLYELYKDFFSLNVTADFLVEMISNELKSDSKLIKTDDIYFIRQYYHNKTKKGLTTSIIPNKKVEIKIPEVDKSIESDELVWTDIDALPQKNKFRQIK